MIDHPAGNYRFLPGISPYSCGVAAAPGYEIVRMALSRTVACGQGFELIARTLERAGRPKQALCGVELRSPSPFSMSGFLDFNRGYRAVLEAWDLMVDGINPVARTNVAPEIDPPPEPSLYAFSFTLPAEPEGPPTFVVAGAGEVREGRLEGSAILRRGETSAEALTEKAAYVLSCMSERLRGLNASWSDATTVNVYTAHDISPFLRSLLLPGIGVAARHGVRRHLCRPPIVDVEYEMDVRGLRTERVLTV